MKYRDPKKDGDSFGMIEHRQSVLKTVEGVNKLDEVIDWELFREELESVLGYAHRDAGRPAALRCGADAEGAGPSENTEEPDTGALRTGLRADDPNGHGPIANHRPATGRTTQRAVQPGL